MHTSESATMINNAIFLDEIGKGMLIAGGFYAVILLGLISHALV